MQPGNATQDPGFGTQPALLGLTSGEGTLAMTGIGSVPNGIKITFTGSPSTTYQVERMAALHINGNWASIGTATTDSIGRAEFTDTNPPQGQGYYRAVSQ